MLRLVHATRQQSSFLYHRIGRPRPSCIPRLEAKAGVSVVSSTLSSSRWSFFSSYRNDMQQRDRGEEGARPRPDTRVMGITVQRRKGREHGYCYGCGADLKVDKSGKKSKGEENNKNNNQHAQQSKEQVQVTERKGGYWADKKALLLKSQLKNWALCFRCKKLNAMSKNDASSSHDAAEASALAPSGRMTEVFRQEVSRIRALEKAVVVLCVDSINISGTLIGTIRKYVGGNPILLAVTRCDLLPEYITKNKIRSNEKLKEFYRRQTQDVIAPAGIYLCSEDPQSMHQFGGIKQLAGDLWEHLDGRDPYIVGAANIGKSTLTDILIHGFLNRGERLQHFRDKLALRRVETLRQARVTKSALAGTTLQNIRVPCFIDHEQALWDTPGLALDESLRHFPIRDLQRLRALRPERIEPMQLEIPKRSFAVLVYETDDQQEMPLLRLEVREKKNDPNGKEGIIKIMWNSTLKNLSTKVIELDQAQREEIARAASIKEMVQQQVTDQPQLRDPLASHDDIPSKHLTAEERKERKAQKKKLFEEMIQKEIDEIGVKEYNRRKEEKREADYLLYRQKKLAKLTEAHRVILPGSAGVDIAVANMGWFGVLAPRMTMVKCYVPNTGVRVIHHNTIGLPEDWGEYEELMEEEEEKVEGERNKKQSSASYDTFDDNGEFSFDEDEDEYSEFDELDDDYESFAYDEDTWDDDYSDGDLGANNYNNVRYVRGASDSYDRHDHEGAGPSKDPWAKYSGENVGWRFDNDTRFSATGRNEGWNPIPKKADDLGGLDK